MGRYHIQESGFPASLFLSLHGATVLDSWTDHKKRRLCSLQKSRMLRHSQISQEPCGTGPCSLLELSVNTPAAQPHGKVGMERDESQGTEQRSESSEAKKRHPWDTAVKSKPVLSPPDCTQQKELLPRSTQHGDLSEKATIRQFQLANIRECTRHEGTPSRLPDST